jgi:hypothetical protein
MARLEPYGRGLIDSELSAKKREVRQQIESDYTAPAVNTGVGYVDEKGRKLVEMQEKMRSAARFTELEDKMSKDKLEKSLFESSKDFVGPKTAQADYRNLTNAAMKTVDFEARKDEQGYPAIYKLPSGDQGGSYEVAGINDRYHPEAYKRISALPPQERAKAAAEYIQGYTAPLVGKLPQAIQPFTQDVAFNRGLGGATKYLQQGLNALGQRVEVDGGLGPKTLAAINQVEPRALMRAASQAQLDDEYRMAERNPARKKFIQGLESRIRNRLAIFGQG